MGAILHHATRAGRWAAPLAQIMALTVALVAVAGSSHEASAQGYLYQRRAASPSPTEGWPRGDGRPQRPRPWPGQGGFGYIPRAAPPPYYDEPPVYIDDDDEPPPRMRARRKRAEPYPRPAPRVERWAAPRRVAAPERSRPRAPPKRVTRAPLQTPLWSVGFPAKGENRFAPREVIVEIQGGGPDAPTAARLRRLGLTQVAAQRLTLIDTTIARYAIPSGRTLRATLNALRSVPAVGYAQPNYTYTLQQIAPAPAQEPKSEAAAAPTPAAEALPQYVADALHLTAAHAVATGAKVRIAIIDSRVDAAHPELSAALAQSVDLIEDGLAAPEDHGTAMAGAIAARARMQSVAPQAELLAARAFSASANATGAQGATYQITRALDWAYAQQARVVNMSFAGPPDPLLKRMIAAAAAKGMILVAAAGNEGPRAAPLYPASDPAVIAVTATDERRQLYDKANRGKYIRIAAPGVSVLAAAPNGSYGFSTGTSIAAAHVSGVVALMLEKHPRLAAAAIRKTLEASGAILQATGDDNVRLTDAAAAVNSPEAATNAQDTPKQE